MDADKEIFGTGEKFREVLEAKIEAKEGMFESEEAYIRVACRGLAARLKGRPFVPLDFALVTELYINDMKTGTDGFTREPMPSDVVGLPRAAAWLVRMAAENIARDAFGDEFAEEVLKTYESIPPAE